MKKNKKYYLLAVFVLTLAILSKIYNPAYLEIMAAQRIINTGAVKSQPTTKEVEYFNKFKQLVKSLPVNQGTFTLTYSRQKDVVLINLYLPDYNVGKEDFKKWISENGYGALPREYFKYNLKNETRTGSQTQTTANPTNGTTYYPIEDSHVNKSQPGVSYGSSRTLQANLTPLMHIFQKYDLSSINKPIKTATLHLTTCGSSNCPTRATYNVYITSNTNWQESSINFNNQPNATEFVGKFTGASLSQNLAINLNPSVIQKYAGRKVTLVIKPTSINDNVLFYSSEVSSSKPSITIAY